MRLLWWCVDSASVEGSCEGVRCRKMTKMTKRVEPIRDAWVGVVERVPF